jgi:hypothetical protein
MTPPKSTPTSEYGLSIFNRLAPYAADIVRDPGAVEALIKDLAKIIRRLDEHDVMTLSAFLAHALKPTPARLQFKAIEGEYHAINGGNTYIINRSSFGWDLDTYDGTDPNDHSAALVRHCGTFPNKRSAEQAARKLADARALTEHARAVADWSDVTPEQRARLSAILRGDVTVPR